VPKRVIDADAMWSSDKLAACAEWAQAEYAWLYGLADASGSFELTNLRVIWGRVAAIRRNFTIERLEQVFDEFNARGLLFRWESSGKRYGHWTGSDVPGRLPAPSWRVRLEKLAPPVPRRELAEYVARFSSGPKQRAEHAAPAGAATPQQGTAQGTSSVGLSELKPRVESAQAQDSGWYLNVDREGSADARLPFARGPARSFAQTFPRTDSQINSQNLPRESANPNSFASPCGEPRGERVGAPWRRGPTWQSRRDARAAQLARDLVVGRGPAVSPLRARNSEPPESRHASESPPRAKGAANGR
jgi:hypothetical protein